jgi:glucosamine--fructose-6-phosphate aminotransferase (isomerizing)
VCIANEGDTRLRKYAHEVLWVPRTCELLLPVVELIPLQLLAYNIALLRGRDIDQPRNIAKSVTAD